MAALPAADASAAAVAALGAAAGQAAAAAHSTSSDFDWRLGLVLAGCAFEAYNRLDDSEKSLKAVSPVGTELTFTNE